MKQLYPYILLFLVICLFGIARLQESKINKRYARTFWKEAYTCGRMNEALKTFPNHDTTDQFKRDSLAMEKKIKLWFQ